MHVSMLEQYESMLASIQAFLYASIQQWMLVSVLVCIFILVYWDTGISAASLLAHLNTGILAYGHTSPGYKNVRFFDPLFIYLYIYMSRLTDCKHLNFYSLTGILRMNCAVKQNTGDWLVQTDRCERVNLSWRCLPHRFSTVRIEGKHDLSTGNRNIRSIFSERHRMRFCQQQRRWSAEEKTSRRRFLNLSLSPTQKCAVTSHTARRGGKVQPKTNKKASVWCWKVCKVWRIVLR